VKALIVNCTLKASPEQSNTGALADVVAEALRGERVEVREVRAANLLAAARALEAHPIPAPPSG
jgi:hypothetical protein